MRERASSARRRRREKCNLTRALLAVSCMATRLAKPLQFAMVECSARFCRGGDVSTSPMTRRPRPSTHWSGEKPDSFKSALRASCVMPMAIFMPAASQIECSRTTAASTALKAPPALSATPFCHGASTGMCRRIVPWASAHCSKFQETNSRPMSATRVPGEGAHVIQQSSKASVTAFVDLSVSSETTCLPLAASTMFSAQ